MRRADDRAKHVTSHPTSDRSKHHSGGYIRGWISTDDLSRKASLNGAAAVLDYVARVTVQFALNPLLVSGLGSYLYGAWRVLWQLGGYLWATSGRSAQALQWVVSSHQRSTDAEEKRQYVASAVIVWCLFLPVLALVGGVGSWFVPVLLGAPEQYVSSLRVAGALLTVDAIALTLLTIPRAVLQGQNLGYKRMGLSAFLIVLGGALMALAIVVDAGIVGVAAANLVTTVLTGALFWHVARRNVSWFGLTRPSRRLVRWFLGLSGWFTAWKFVYEFMMAADVLVLGFFASVQLVTVYTLTKSIPEALIVFLTMNLLHGTGPGLGGIIGGGDLGRGNRVRNEIMVLTWLVATVVGATVLIWNRSFVGLWVGERFYAGGTSSLLIVMLAMQFLFISNDARVIDMTLNVRKKVLTGAVAAGLSFAFAVILMDRNDDKIAGMCLGLIIGRSILTIAYPMMVGRFLEVPFARQLKGALRPAMTTALLFAISMELGERVATDAWVSLVGLSGGTAAALIVVSTVVGLTARQRRSLLERARKTLQGRGSETSPSPPAT